LPSAVTDVEHVDSLASLEDTMDDAIDMRFVPVKKVPQSLILRNHDRPVGMFFQTKNCAFKTFVPSKSTYRVGGVNMFKEQFQITPGSGHELNEISHTFA
jgi:hypothetical protein